MGIALPFVGYVKARGAQTVRNDPKSTINDDRSRKIKEFFRAMRSANPQWFSGFVRGDEHEHWSTCFEEEVSIETDDVTRPELVKYLKRSGDSTLVISTWNDLFEVENDVVDELVKRCLEIWSPILCLDHRRDPLMPGSVAPSGPNLPYLIMRNQSRVQESIEARASKILSLRKKAVIC